MANERIAAGAYRSLSRVRTHRLLTPTSLDALCGTASTNNYYSSSSSNHFAGPSNPCVLPAFLSAETHAYSGSSTLRNGHSRSFSSSSSNHFHSTTSRDVSAHRKAAGREKARLRTQRQQDRLTRSKQKDFPSTSSGSRPDAKFSRPIDPVEEEVESQIRSYMARTGPKGERLTLSEQERLLKQELKSLGLELDKLEKQAKSEAQTSQLPPLDDQTLDELYQALMLPPPPKPEDSRLARLEDGRRTKALLSGQNASEARNSGSIASSLVSTNLVEQRRRTTSRTLKQKLLEARERGRILLPSPPLSQTSTSRSELAEWGEQDQMEVEQQQEDTDMIDLSSLPHRERQEIRLQQLFARLAIVHTTSPTSESNDADESLQDLKSDLAKRIARILERREHVLPPTDTQPDPIQSESQQEQSQIPEFQALRLDHKTADISDLDPTLPPTPPTSTSVSSYEMIAKAESMLQDLSSFESRKFMLDGIERLIPADSSKTSDLPQEEPSATPSLPLGVASWEEWTALAVSSARADDSSSLQRTFLLMKRSGYFPAPLEFYNDVMDIYASRGDVGKCQELLSLLSAESLVPDDHTYHNLAKAHINSNRFVEAFQLLRSLEDQGRPASMATYTFVIDRLLEPVPVFVGAQGRDGLSGPLQQQQQTQQRPELQALAWNLFYHMRLAAHPVPDAPLYALMIRACAKGVPQPQDIDDPTKSYSSLSFDSSTTTTRAPASGPTANRISEAERALDLFREMTTRYNVRPNAEVYNNLILACSRRKDFYLEAFRLLREMVELETDRLNVPSPSDGDAIGSSDSAITSGSGSSQDQSLGPMMRFAPDTYTFNALLQGCSRNRDLARARWVLAEMIRTTIPLFDPSLRSKLSRNQKLDLLAKRPNQETLCHIFHAYASYNPPVKRAQMKISRTDGLQTPSETPANLTETATRESGTNPNVPITAPSTDNDAVDTTSSHLTKMDTSTDPVPSNQPETEETTADESAYVFSSLVPQTSSDLIAEARSLFARVLADQPRPTPDNEGTQGARIEEGPLGAVQPGIRLVNAYLSILANHLPTHLKGRILSSTIKGLNSREHAIRSVNTLESSNPEHIASDADEGTGQLEDKLFLKLGLRPNEFTYKILLEAFSDLPAVHVDDGGSGNSHPSSSSSSSSLELVRMVEHTWAQFRHHETQSTLNPTDTNANGDVGVVGMDPIQVKKCWSAYIHFWAKNASLITASPPATPKTRDASQQHQDQQQITGLDKCMQLLKELVKLYPPARNRGSSNETHSTLVNHNAKPKAVDIVATDGGESGQVGDGPELRFGDSSPLSNTPPNVKRPPRSANPSKARVSKVPVDLLPPFPIPHKSRLTLEYLSLLNGANPLPPSPTPSSTQQQEHATTSTSTTTINSPPSASASASPSLPIQLHFLDVQLLHHKLVRFNRIKDLAYLSWILRSYQASAKAGPRARSLRSKSTSR